MVQNIRRDELISIHILRVEDDILEHYETRPEVTFQSTSSVWRMTLAGSKILSMLSDFNPHPPCGG